MDYMQGSLYLLELQYDRLATLQRELMDQYCVAESRKNNGEAGIAANTDTQAGDIKVIQEVGTGVYLTYILGAFEVRMKNVVEKAPTHAMDARTVFDELEDSPDELFQVAKDIAVLGLRTVYGMSRFSAEFGSEAGTARKMPPVLPLRLADLTSREI